MWRDSQHETSGLLSEEHVVGVVGAHHLRHCLRVGCGQPPTLVVPAVQSDTGTRIAFLGTEVATVKQEIEVVKTLMGKNKWHLCAGP